MQLELKLPNPVYIDRIEVFRWREQTFVRVTSRDKQVGTATAGDLYPHVRTTLSDVIRYFVNKDARDLAKLIDELETDDRFLPLRGLNVWPAVAPIVSVDGNLAVPAGRDNAGFRENLSQQFPK